MKDLKLAVLGNTSSPSQPTKLTSLLDYNSAPYGGMMFCTCQRPVHPSWCWFYVRQDQQTNPILMGISQDRRYPALVSASVGGRCVPDLQSLVKTLSWVVVLWSFAALCASNMEEFSSDGLTFEHLIGDVVLFRVLNHQFGAKTNGWGP